MRIFLKVLNIFFVALGIIFSFVIVAGVYLYVADPFNLKTVFINKPVVSPATPTDAHPLLNNSQERALETVGIDPASVPTQITKEQEACFMDKIGADRVSEIKTGSAPTAMEVFKARDCIQ